MRIAPFALVALGSLTLATSAFAKDLSSCGDFFFDATDASVSCEVEVSGGCTAKCEPVAFQVECAAELQVGCQGGCNVQADVECTTACQGSCVTECEAGNFDCNASCEGNCSADCSTTCAGSADSAKCNASCNANCQASCSANCDASAPDCQTQCQGCCTGECEAEINAQCQIDCQAEGYVQCEADLQGGCEAQCEQPEGALFCNGEWVDASDFDQCVADIQATFDIEVTGYANGECSGNSCTGEAGCSSSCATAPASPDFTFAVVAAGAVGLAAAVGRRVTRKKK